MKSHFCKHGGQIREGRKLQMQDIYIFSAAEENDVSTLSTSCGEVAAKIWVISTIWNAKHTDLHNLPMKKNFYIFRILLARKMIRKMLRSILTKSAWSFPFKNPQCASNFGLAKSFLKLLVMAAFEDH